MSQDKQSGFLGSLGHLVGVDFNDESAPEIPVQEHPAPVAHFQPALPHGLVPLPMAVHTVAVSDDAVEAKMQERFVKNLPDVLAAAPANFQTFLEKKAELTEALADGGLSAAQVEAAAIKGALRSANLSAADISQAVSVMRQKREDLQAEFAGKLQQSRVTKIEEPARQIEQSLEQVKQLEVQIANFQQQVANLKSGVQPAKEAIAAAEQKLAQVQVIDDGAGAKIDQYLEGLQQNLLSRLPK